MNMKTDCKEKQCTQREILKYKTFFLFKDKSKRLIFIFLDISAFSALMSEEM